MGRAEREAAVALIAIMAVAAGCVAGESESGDGAPSDTAYAALQERGEDVMGVDQYTSTHLFDALPDGGRIELQRDVDDPEGVEQIRRHLREIAQAFAEGDFGKPAVVHMGEVPGAAVMAAKRDRITYTFGELPRGGEVRIVTADAEAIAAIHEFMAFQRSDHRSGGESGMDHGAMGHDSAGH